jgi:hypothetical protein
MILDVFTIMFEADTSKAKSGVDETRKSTDELVDSMKKADDQAGKTGASMAGFAAKALGALTAAVSIGQTIRGAIDRAGMVHLMNQTSESIGVAVEDMDAFRRSVEDTGGTAQGAEQTFVKMAESIGQALSKTDSEQAKTFAALGVNLKDAEGNALNASDGILAVAGAIEGMDKAQARFTLKQLQITDPKTVELILKGRKEIENTTRAHKEQGVITKEMAIQAGKLDTAMNALRGGMERAGLGIMDALLPAIIKGVEWLTIIVDWAGEHKDFVVGFFAAIAAVVAAVYLPAMVSAAAATLAATWPIIAIGAAIIAAAAAFALIYDDIMNFIDGNDSLIGQMVEKYPLVAAMVEMVAAAFRTLMEWGGIAFDFLGKAVGIWADAMKLAFDGIIAYFKLVADMWAAVFGGVMSGIGKVSAGLSKVGGWLGIGGDVDITSANEQLAVAGANPMNSISSSAISNTANNNREQNVQIGQVTVQTQATDSQGISQSISSDLSVQLKALEAETATGIDR